MFKDRVTDIFFDLDHTLWDFEKNSALTFEKILGEHGVDVPLDAFLETYIPINMAYWKLYREEKVSKAALRFERLHKTFQAIGREVRPDKINALSDAYIEHLSSFNHIFPSTKEILDYLRPDYRLHIITNGFAEIQTKKLLNAGIHDYFKVIVNSEMAGVKKPDPKIFKMALELANVKPQNALMIGDSLEADILGAQKVGLHTLHFNSNQEPAHEFCAIITHLGEIKNFL